MIYIFYYFLFCLVCYILTRLIEHRNGYRITYGDEITLLIASIVPIVNIIFLFTLIEMSKFWYKKSCFSPKKDMAT